MSNPRNIQARVLLADLYYCERDFAVAKKESLDALDLAGNAKNSSTRMIRPLSTRLGLVYYKKGLYNFAVGELTTAADKLPDNAVIRCHLGMAYLKKANSEKARRELEKAFSLYGSFEGAEAARIALADHKWCFSKNFIKI